MNEFANALWIEMRKSTRSKVPFFTLLGFMMLPLACGIFMIIYKYPDFARDIGMVSAKASLIGGSADWPFYLSMYAQGFAIGGLLLDSLLISWIFGREFSDGTFKDLIAVPVSRGAIMGAKFITASVWGLVLTAVIYLVGLVVGALIGLPLGSKTLFYHGSITVLVTTCLVILSVFPVAFFACVGHGYLLSMGMAILMLVVANIIAVLGWGDYFPWSIPALYAGLSGNENTLTNASYWIVALVGAAGIGATYLWWMTADHKR